jgi:hypothetical protein
MSLLDILDPARREPVPDEQRERWLDVVPRAPFKAPRVPFVLLVLVVLGVGLVGLLLLNTSLQQGSFAIHDLQRQTSLLADRQSELERQVAVLAAPESLASRAVKLGMVPNPNPAFLRLSDGRVLGDPQPAKALPKPKPKPKVAAKPPAKTPAKTPVKTPAKPKTPVKPASGAAR